MTREARHPSKTVNPTMQGTPTRTEREYKHKDHAIATPYGNSDDVDVTKYNLLMKDDEASV